MKDILLLLLINAMVVAIDRIIEIHTGWNSTQAWRAVRAYGRLINDGAVLSGTGRRQVLSVPEDVAERHGLLREWATINKTK